MRQLHAECGRGDQRMKAAREFSKPYQARDGRKPKAPAEPESAGNSDAPGRDDSGNEAS